jgi:ribosomal-protein-alanine N-acetyltransferase
MITYDIATKSDLNQLSELEKDVFEKHVAFSKKDWHKLLQNKRVMIHVVRDKEKIIADIVIVKFKLLRWIYSLAVAKAYQRKGHARRFLTQLLFFRKKCIFVLEVASDNIPAIKLYRSVGFETIALLKDYYGPKQDAYRMMKK